MTVVLQSSALEARLLCLELLRSRLFVTNVVWPVHKADHFLGILI